MQKDAQKISIEMGASFTCDTMKPYVSRWLSKFDMQPSIDVLPFDQVLQALIEREAREGASADFLILLQRLEDFEQNFSSISRFKEDIIVCLNQYKNLIQKYVGKAKLMIGLFELSDEVIKYGEDACKFLKEANDEFASFLFSMDHVTVLDFRYIGEDYLVSRKYDELAYRLGFLPFTDEYVISASSIIARSLVSHLIAPHKVIVVDCDNTIWKGECANNTAEVTSDYLIFQKYLLQKKNEGFLLAICSKNDYADVEDFLNKGGNLLSMQDFVTCRINWNIKSENIRSIATELNLGLDSFVFFDDSVHECLEVMNALPQVLTLQFPFDSEAIGGYIRHIWALDKVNITSEDLIRTNLYQQERERKELSDSVVSMDEYIGKLEMKIYVSPMETEDYDRVTQLINRTNQFNLNTVRRSKEQLLSFLGKEDNAGYIVQCRDRYGDYGISGVILLSENEKSIELDTFLLSCRVLGRRVENAVLAYLLSLCGQRNCRTLLARFCDSGRNKPVKQFLDSGYFGLQCESNDGSVYACAPEVLQDVEKSLLNIQICNTRFVNEEANDKIDVAFEHIGVAVSNMTEAANLYEKTGFHVGKAVSDPCQKATLCMCSRFGCPDVELIEPAKDNSLLRELLGEKEFKPYHICLSVTDINLLQKELSDRGMDYVEVSAPKPALLFDMDRVTFIYFEGVGIIEFRERKELPKAVCGSRVRVRYESAGCHNAVKLFGALGLSVYEKTKSSVVFRGDGYPYLEFIETNNVSERYNIEKIVYEESALGSEFFGADTGNALKQHAESAGYHEWDVLYDDKNYAYSNIFRLALDKHSAGKLLQEYAQISQSDSDFEGDIRSCIYNLIKMVLKHSDIDVKRNFASNGGNSLQALSLLSKINNKFYMVASLEDVLLSESIEKFADNLLGNSKADNEVCFEHFEDVKRVPATVSQRRMYMYQVLNPESTAYNMPRCLYIDGRCDTQKLLDSFMQLVESHRGLRLNFEDNENGVYQYEREAYELPFKEYRSEKSTYEVIREFIRPFKLSEELLIRIEVVHTGDDKNLFLFDIHHILVDGTSLAKIINDLFCTYSGKTIYKSKYDMMDYAIYSEKVCDGNSDFWKESIPDTCLPIDSTTYTVNTFRGNKLLFSVTEKVMDKVFELADSMGVSLNAVMLAAYALLLAKYTGEDKVTISVPMGGRDRAESEDIIGLIIDTVPLCIDMEYDSSVEEFIKYVGTVLVEGYAHRNFPYDLYKDNSFRLAYIMQNMENKDFVSSNIYWEKPGTDDFVLEPIEFDEGVSKYDVSFEVSEHEGKVKVSIEYCTDLFEKKTIDNLFDNFVDLCEVLCTDSSRKLKDISVTEDMGKCILEGEKQEYEIHTLVEGLKKTAEIYPNKTAVSDDCVKITYSELVDRAERIAGCLMEYGVEKGDIVAVLADRSARVAQMLFGVMMAGAAYLPLSKEYPVSRIRKILTSSGAKLVLSDEDGLEMDIPVILFRNDFTANACTELPTVCDDDRSYVVYTSGTTGEPKGVQILHRGIVNYAMWRVENYGLTCEDSALELLPMSFDGFCSNFYSTLLSGGRVVMVDDNHWRDFEYIGTTIEIEKITNISLLPTMYRGILENSSDEQLESLRMVILAGEKTDRNLIQNSREKNPQILLVNEYGATENTVTTSANIGMNENNNDSVGRPIANNYVCVLDSFENVLPKGMCGELAVWGKSLSCGYLNDEELTARRFKGNLHIQNNAFMYRTGDRVRIDAHGQIRFIGRIDNQVKYRGFRIELSEIEQVALRLDGICAAVATVVNRKDKQELCLFVCGKSVPDGKHIGQTLKEYLPPYMIPSFYAVVENIPMTSNGKVDVKKLAENDLLYLGETEKLLPQNDIEQRLWNICADILKIDDFGMNSGFMSIGGQSLDVAKLKKRIYDEFGVDQSMSVLFKVDSLREIANLIALDGEQSVAEIKHFEYGRKVPMSSAQKRIFLLEQIENVGKSYHIPVFFRIKGTLDIPRLEKALEDIVREHEILRTTFDFVEGEPVQIINDPYDVHVDKADVCFEDIDYVSWSERFELTQLPLFRAVLFTDNVLLIEFHHIVTDGASIKMFTEELSNRYNGYPVTMAQLQYAEYVLHDMECNDNKEKNGNYWHSVFEDIPEPLNYPTDFSRKDVVGYKGRSLSICLNENLTKKVSEYAAKINVTEFALLFSAYNIMLSRICGTNDIVVGIPTLGRNNAEYADIQGIFINVLAIRTNIDSELTVDGYVSKMAENLIEAYEHEDYPFEKLVEEISVPKVTNRKTLFDVMFVMRDFERLQLTLEDGVCDVIDYMPDVAKYDFTLTVTKDEALKLMFQYNKDLFEESTALNMLNRYVSVLEQMVEQPESRLNKITALFEEEEQAIERYERGNIAENSFDSIIEGLLKGAENNLSRWAIVGPERSVTYREFLTEVKTAVDKLYSLGIGKGDIVAMAVEPSVDMIECAIAIQCLGAAYLPLDVATPAARISFCINDAGARLFITDDENAVKADGIKTVSSRELICLDIAENDREEFKNIFDEMQKYRVEKDDSAYIIYTSGTTGVPKGVMVSQGNLANYTNWFIRENRLETGVTSALLSGFNFDLGYSVVYPTLALAGTLHLPKKTDYLEKAATLRFIKDKAIEYLKMTPTLFSFLFSECEAELGKLRLIVLGGESLNNREVEEFMRNYPEIEIMNHYGPTETTIGTVFNKLSAGKCIMHNMHPIIGRPVDNSLIYILDKENRRVPNGTPGEICVAGKGVSKGYLNVAQNDKFVKNPFSSEFPRLYKTGDYGYRLENGEIVFIGRKDKQVKIHGYRVDINEIKDSLLEYEKIDNALVVVDESGENEKRILAFYIPSGEIDEKELRIFMRQRVTEYMIPTVFTRVASFPMNKNGKLDMTELLSHVSVDRRAIEEEISDGCKAVKALWETVLGRNDFSVDDNFFDVGGNSILLIKLQEMLKDELGLDVRVVDMFVHPTVRRLASLMNDRKDTFDIEGIRVSADWFDISENDDVNDNFYISFTGDEKDRISNLVQRFGISSEALFAALYTYIWNQITGEKIQLPWKCEDGLYRIFDGDMDEIEDFDDLFIKTYEALGKGYPAGEVKLSKEEDRLYFGGGSNRDKQNEIFDVFVQIINGDEELRLTVRLDTTRINPDLVRMLLGQTGDLLSYVLARYS